MASSESVPYEVVFDRGDTNRGFGDWGQVFADQVVATAILDRLLHHSVTLNIRGNSYRLKEKLKAGLVRAEETTDS